MINMILNFIVYLLTVGILAAGVVVLAVILPLGNYESKIKRAKREEIASKYVWSFEINKAYNAWEEEYDSARGNYWLAALILMIAVAIGSAGIFTYADYMFEKTPWTEENYVTHQIINLADNNEISGRISGGRYHTSGYVGEITVYQYYYVTARGSWDLQKTGEKTTEFFPTTGEPCARWYRAHKKFWWNEDTKYRCDIYIPESAMITDFIIDME